MKHCDKCKIDIQGQLTYCPLCQSELTNKNNNREEELFPDSYSIYTSRHLFLRVIGFLAIAISAICTLINFLVPTKFYWCFIVIAALGCVWFSLAAAITKHRHILKYLLYQCMIICIFTIFLDYYTGGTGWSLDIVMPIVFMVAMVLMYFLSKILHLKASDYIIYLLIDALFGLLPLILILLGVAHHITLSIVCIAISSIFILALLMFEGRAMREELNKRFHI